MLKHVREAIRMSGIPAGQIECRHSKGHIHLIYNGRTVVCGSSPTDRDSSARLTAKNLKRIVNLHNTH